MSTYLSRVIGKKPVKFPQIAEGQQIGKRGEIKIIAESFNALGQLILSIKDKHWRKIGEGAFGSYLRKEAQIVKV